MKFSKKKKEQIKLIVKLANLIRDAFRSSDISIIMSPRTSIIWAQNIEIFEDVDTAFKLTFFNRCDESDKKVELLMNDLSSKSLFNLEKKEIDKIKKDFEAVKVTDEETVSIINEIYKEHQFIIDPHTATGVGAAKSFKNLGDIVVLGTAHPYKFNDTIKKAIGKNLDSPEHLKLNIDKKETFDIIRNSNSEVKNYILGKIQ